MDFNNGKFDIKTNKEHAALKEKIKQSSKLGVAHSNEHQLFWMQFFDVNKKYSTIGWLMRVDAAMHARVSYVQGVA